MACFIVSAIGATAAGIAKHIVKHQEKKNALVVSDELKEYKFGSEVKWSTKLSYLELTLWGGSFFLMIEHVIHGEVTFIPPFLTAMSSKEDTITMLQEMGTVGVIMFVTLLVAWAIGVFAVDFIKYRKHKAKEVEAKEK